jgi:hypothetical protein
MRRAIAAAVQAVIAIGFSVVAAIIYEALPKIALRMARAASALTPMALRDIVDPYADTFAAVEEISVDGDETHFSVFRLASGALFVGVPRLLLLQLAVAVQVSMLYREARTALNSSPWLDACEPLTVRWAAKWVLTRNALEQRVVSKAESSARWLTRHGLNWWVRTVVAAGFSLVGCAFIFANQLSWAAFAVTFGFLLGLLIIRPVHRAQSAILVSFVADRTTDAAMYGSLAWWFHSQDPRMAVVCITAGVLTFLGTYIRAEGGRLGLADSYPFIGRAERQFVLVGAVWSGALGGFVWMRVAVVIVLLATIVQVAEQVIPVFRSEMLLSTPTVDSAGTAIDGQTGQPASDSESTDS